jgi:carboxylesterase type B
VRVSEAIFNARGTGKGAPVVVWIHGGGYIQGYKSQEGSGRGLILASEQYNGTGIVYVAINYRLGLFVRLLHAPVLMRGDPSVTSFAFTKKSF